MSVSKVSSWAQSGETYAGNQCFRVRRLLDKGRVRLHIARPLVREREAYLAVDLIAADFVKALEMIGVITPSSPTPGEPGHDDLSNC